MKAAAGAGIRSKEQVQQVQKESILISASGRDQPGIVDRVSGAIFDAGANLEDSRMPIL